MISNWEDIRLKTTPNARRVSGTLKKIEVSEGYYGVFVQPGYSKDPRYESYPYWRLYVEVPKSSINIENDKANNDNHANQCNPNNGEYEHSREDKNEEE